MPALQKEMQASSTSNFRYFTCLLDKGHINITSGWFICIRYKEKPLQHPSHFGMRIAAVYLLGTNYSIFVISQSSFTRWVNPLFSSSSGIDAVQMISPFSPRAVIVNPRRSV